MVLLSILKSPALERSTRGAERSQNFEIVIFGAAEVETEFPALDASHVPCRLLEGVSVRGHGCKGHPPVSIDGAQCKC